MQKNHTPEKSESASALNTALRQVEEKLADARDFFRVVEMASESLQQEDASAFLRVLERGNDCLVEALTIIKDLREADHAG